MAELPESWGLTTKPRDDGKLDIVGKDDSGHEYRVRTTDANQVSERDISDLKAADRESYPNRQTAVREQIKNLVGEPEKKLTMLEAAEMSSRFDESEWIAAAEPVIHAGFERQGSTIGSTWQYRRNFDDWIKSFERSN